MRYAIKVYPFLGGFHVVIKDYGPDCNVRSSSVSSEFLSSVDPHKDDFMHFLGELYEEVASTTP